MQNAYKQICYYIAAQELNRILCKVDNIIQLQVYYHILLSFLLWNKYVNMM